MNKSEILLHNGIILFLFLLKIGTGYIFIVIWIYSKNDKYLN